MACKGSWPGQTCSKEPVPPEKGEPTSKHDLSGKVAEGEEPSDCRRYQQLCRLFAVQLFPWEGRL